MANLILTCCKRGSEIVRWRKVDFWNGPDEAGFSININERYPDPAFVTINYCPFCGKKVGKGFISRYMMGTKAFHQMGDINRDEEDLCFIRREDGDNYIGEWVTGYGFIEVKFPQVSTRELTRDEIEKYDSMYVRINSQPAIKLNIRDNT